MQRKLAAILCADAYGYSRLMGDDEEATLRTLTSHRLLIDSSITQHHGRFVNSAGDSVLAEFASVVDAMDCAVEIQTELKATNANVPPPRRMEFRIGVNLGDVIVEGEQIYGDGVNVAARLETLASPGGICISGTVHDQVRDKLALRYEDHGEQAVKNIRRPVRVWRVLLEEEATPRGEICRKTRYWQGGALSAAGIVMLVAVFVLVQHLSLQPLATHASIPGPREPALSLPSIPSIAVLPFTNQSGDPQQEYFSDGITDDLTTDLSRVPKLFVIARTSSFVYKGKSEKAQTIGRELGVKYLVEGSARRVGDQLRINVQLVEAASGNEVWAQRYDLQMRDIFKLQDQIVQSLVTTLGLQMSLLEKGFRVPQRTSSLEAYDCVLRATEQFLDATTREDFENSAKMIEKAIALDPGYAEAYSDLGKIYLLEYDWYLTDDPSVLNRVEELERKALRLDDSNASAYTYLGEITAERGRGDQAIADVKRAISLDPNDSYSYLVLARFLNDEGRHEEALAYAHRAMRLDPKRTQFYSDTAGRALIAMGRLTEALNALRAGDLASPLVHLDLIYAYTELGRKQDARSEALETLRIAPSFSLERLWERNPGYWNTKSGRRYLDDLQQAGLR